MNKIIHGDCLEEMAKLEAGSIDFVLCDPPYGTTECAWDSVIPFEPMWGQLSRIVKPEGAIVLMGAGGFSARLITSNEPLYRYSMVWKKSRAGRFAQAKNRFLNTHEDILVFSKGKCGMNAKIKMRYFPQGLRPLNKVMPDRSHKNGLRVGRKQLRPYLQEFTGYPGSVLEFGSVSRTIHPTQKPVPLLEYLIKSFSTEGDTVLDFTMGSGSTGVACKNLNRNFIGIEKDDKYFAIAEARIKAATPTPAPAHHHTTPEA